MDCSVINKNVKTVTRIDKRMFVMMIKSHIFSLSLQKTKLHSGN